MVVVVGVLKMTLRYICDLTSVLSPLFSPAVIAWLAECSLQSEQRAATDWQICHSLSVSLTLLSLTVTTTLLCSTDSLGCVIFVLSPTFCARCLTILSSSPHRTPLPSFPTVSPVSSSLSSLLTAVPQHQWCNSLQLFVLLPFFHQIPLLPLLVLRSISILTAVMEHWCGKILFFCDLTYFGFCSIWLDPHSGICHPTWWVTERERIESFFSHFLSLLLHLPLPLLLFLLPSFPSSSFSSSSQGFTVIPFLYQNVCVHVKCSRPPLSVMHVDKVWSERWRWDMSLPASTSLFPSYFFVHILSLATEELTNNNPIEGLFLFNCIHTGLVRWDMGSLLA